MDSASYTKYVGDFPIPPNLPVCHTTNGISCGSDVTLIIQIWHRPHSLRAPPHKTAPLLRCQSQVPGCHLYFWPSGCKEGIPNNPSSGSEICCNSSQNSGKHLGLPLYYKGYNKRCRWIVRWRGTQGLWICIHQSVSSPNPEFRDFYEGCIT